MLIDPSSDVSLTTAPHAREVLNPEAASSYLPLPTANALLDAYRKRYPMVVRSVEASSGGLGGGPHHTDHPLSAALHPIAGAWTGSGSVPDTLDTHLKRIFDAPLHHPAPPLRFAQLASNIPRAAIGSQAHGPPGANVFVFHIPNEWDEHELAVHFAQFGPILSARIATEKSSGRRLGFGFVSYTDVEPACRAVNVLNGYPVAGKRLKVTIKRGEQQHVPGQYTTATRQANKQQSTAPSPPNQTPTGRSPLSANLIDRNTDLNTKNPSSSNGTSVENASEVGTRTSSHITHKSGRKTRLSSPDTSSKTRSTNGKSLPEAATSSGGSSDEEQQSYDNQSAAATLRRIETLFSKILEKLDDAPSSEADWLQSLTCLLRASQGRQFVYTLLQAAGLTSSELEESPPAVNDDDTPS